MQSYPSINKEEVIESIKDFMGFLKKLLVYILGSVKRFFVLAILIIAIIIGIGYYHNQRAPSFYSSTMVCTYNYLHKKVYGEMLHRLNYLVENQSYAALTNELNIPVETAKKIVGIKARNIAGSPLHEDITEDKLPLYFTVIVTDKDLFPVLQEAIVDYLNTSIPFRQKRIQLELERYNEKIDFLNATLQQIDSVIYEYRNNLDSFQGKGDTISGLFGFVRLLQLKEDLKNRKLSDQKMMQLQMSIEVIYGFAPTDYPNIKTSYSLGKIILLAIAVAIGTVLALNLLWPKRKSA